MAYPHLLVIPFPAQGHVLPLMELSECLALEGFKVTFVFTEFVHKRVVDSMKDASSEVKDRIHLVSISDGLELCDDRSDLSVLHESIAKAVPGNLEDLINSINMTDDDKITSVIADLNISCALVVAAKLGIRRVAVWPASAALLTLIRSVQELIANGIINQHGTPLVTKKMRLAPDMPSMNPAHFAWACIGDITVQQKIFGAVKLISKCYELADKVICNTSYDLENAALKMDPRILPIGPRLASSRREKAQGNFWSEDSSCLEWLDTQAPNSVIYAAFGSFTTLTKSQFDELALGLELTNMPFLWVVRPDFMDMSDASYPEGFKERVSGRGLMVGWAPQQKVLAHPAVTCFISHCGWNSTMEGVYNGVPFLCWPYFADQFLDETYICDVWKIGLGLEKDENGIITRDEIKAKVLKLVDGGSCRQRAFELKMKVNNSMNEGGSSYINFQNIVQWLKLTENKNV